MATTTQKWVSNGLLSLCLGLAGSACGDDGGSSSPPPKRKKSKKKKSKKPPKVSGKSPMAYPKVPDEFRHQFTDLDFIPDPSGETNRDPFRSWVLKPALAPDEEPKVKATDVCTEGKVRWGAPSYSVRDLELIGLVKRGRSYAQFTDRSEKDSWIVRKGDCLGQEKAIIEEIGLGYVRLSITPPAPPGAPAPPPQLQDISLHPDELEIADGIINNFEDDG